VPVPDHPLPTAVTAARHVRPGLCSITFRALSAEAVVELAANAGLESIEWGADVHAPPDDPATLDRVRTLTEAAGLVVASYGSYYRAAPGDADPTAPAGLVDAAERLGTTRVRVWAGRYGSAEASTDDRAGTVRELQHACDLAAGAGVELGLEFHRGTLTDTVASTDRLLEEVGRDNLSTYWQPPVGIDDDEAAAGLDALLPHVSAVHVFSWGPGGERLPLAARAVLWQRVLTAAQTAPACTDALLEFVAGDEPTLLRTEALTLRALLAGSAA
jgi:3-dehydroshikimate dehydratase